MSLNNSPEYSQSTSQKHTSGWRVVRAAGGADGTAIVSPFEFLLGPVEFDTSHELGWTQPFVGTPGTADMGRTILAVGQGDNIEFMGLFSTAAATCQIQPWGFDWISPSAGVGSPAGNAEYRRACPAPSKGDRHTFAMNVPCNLSRVLDPTSATITLTARAERVRFRFIGDGPAPTAADGGFGAPVIPVVDPDQPAGTADLYYMSDRKTVPLRGLPAVWTYVSTVSAGAVAVLARIY